MEGNNHGNDAAVMPTVGDICKTLCLYSSKWPGCWLFMIDTQARKLHLIWSTEGTTEYRHRVALDKLTRQGASEYVTEDILTSLEKQLRDNGEI